MTLSIAFPAVLYPTARRYTMETAHDLNDSTIDGLQSLCKLCHDSAEGYRTAADQLNASALQQAFRNTADQRVAARDDLAGMLGMSHADVPDSGTALGSIHRWWLDLRSTLSADNEDAVLAEAIRGEETIEDKYESVLKDTGGSPANRMLQQQLSSVKACRKTLEDLREAM